MSVPVLVFGAIVVLVAAAVTLYYRLTREEGTHKAPSTRLPPSGRRVARAGRRAAGAARRLPGAKWLRREWDGLGDWDDHDARTAAVFHQIRIELHHEEFMTAPPPEDFTSWEDAPTRPRRVEGTPDQPGLSGGRGLAPTGATAPATAPPFQGGHLTAPPVHDPALWGPAVQPPVDEHGLPPMSPALARALQEAEDAQRWPELMPRYGYQDATGEFTRIVAEAVA